MQTVTESHKIILVAIFNTQVLYITIRLQSGENMADSEDPSFFLHEASRMLSVQISTRQFCSIFGCSPTVAGRAWHMIGNCLDPYPIGFTAEKLLWALLLLKQYPTQDFLAAICKVSRECFRKWSMYCIHSLALLCDDLVSGIN